MVIGLKRAGWSIRQIAADTHLGASTVHRLWRRWLEQGNVAIYRNVGATRVTSARVDRRILRQAVAAPQATCTAILQHVQDTLDHSISTRTISRRLVANGLHSCRPLRRLPLTPPNRRQRLEWCRARSTWMTEWHRVVFSDESRFCLSSDSRRVRVWRRRGERSNPAAIVERPTVRQRGIMVWGAIAYDSRSPLLRIQGTMTAQRYVDDVLRPVTLPYLQGVPNALYQQDNARPHTARISQQALQDVQMLPWPPYSPDISPIEHVWDIIGRRLHALPQPRSEDELWQMVKREWRAIPQDAIRTLIDSLPRRVAACIAVRVYIRTGKPGRPRKEYPTINLSTQELLEAKYLPDPKDAEEALSGRDSYFWKKAMEEKFDSLIENKTWELVDPPKNRNIIGTKWVFKTKCNSDGSVERHKARLVAKGYSQQYGIDYEETFAPIVRQSTIRMFLALTVEYNLILHQMDVQSAYLNGEIKEEIFMTQPENFVSRKYPEKVCRLKKAIYGLKQAGIVWHEKLDTELKNLELKQLQSDNCVYIKHDEGILLVAIYVDDLIIAAEREDTLKSFKESMKRIFKVKDLGGINCCLGIRIQMKEEGSISIDQERYIEELLAKYRMKEAKPISTPMDSNSKLTKISSIEGENEPVKKVEYQSLIGSLIYLSVSTRPDIAYAVSALGQFSNDLRRQHWNAAKRVLRYLKGTSCLRITYRKSNEALHGYADADWGGNLVDRKSHTGIVYFLVRGPIAWESKKQQTVTLSSTESEYIALCEAGKEAVYLRALLDEMGFGELLNGPTVLKTDNQGAQQLARNPAYHARTKHIDIKWHFIRSICSDGLVEVVHTPTQENVADILTKRLPRRLGHLNRYSLKKLGLPSSQEKCETCIKGKSSRRSFEKTWKTTKEIGELIHSDLSGPIDPPTYDGEIYFQVLIDDYSHFVVVRLLKSKSEAEQNIIDFIKLIKTQHNKKTRKIRVDNGKEFSSGNFKQFCRTKGIQIEYTSSYTPQQNGTSERMNRTLIDKVRTKLAETNLPKYLWGEAIYCSAYELNRSPTSANKGIPLAKIWYKQNDLSKLKVFGSRAWRLILPKPRKLDARAKSTIMVGYSGSGYRIWDPETDKVMISTDVTFDETLTKFDKEIISDQTEPKRITTESQDEEENPQTSEQSDKEESVTTRSGRIIKPPRYQEDYELYSVYCLFTNGVKIVQLTFVKMPIEGGC
ncbi:hypothetical protein LAZ67_3005177 [Cordylochernes scorpioides]|uniref:Integrase catalytic domain-containing protein n=1 Tax=Cordylochernes scorpioides TaxID=51811 RepID=A0ABY6KA19_9ARAC|nr:hypothetical protein LAZ67_3005177 [Cordylochernes scorpioides]